MRDTSILLIENVIKDANQNARLIDGKYVPARCEGFCSWRYRLKATWLVFTGKADALVWHKQ